MGTPTPPLWYGPNLTDIRLRRLIDLHTGTHPEKWSLLEGKEGRFGFFDLGSIDV